MDFNPRKLFWKNWFVLLLGFFVLVLPFLGFPARVDRWLYTLAGLGIVSFSFMMGRALSWASSFNASSSTHSAGASSSAIASRRAGIGLEKANTVRAPRRATARTRRSTASTDMATSAEGVVVAGPSLLSKEAYLDSGSALSIEPKAEPKAPAGPAYDTWSAASSPTKTLPDSRAEEQKEHDTETPASSPELISESGESETSFEWHSKTDKDDTEKERHE